MNRRTQRWRPLVLFTFSLGYAVYLSSTFLLAVFAAPFVFLLTPFPRAKYALLHHVTQAYLVFLVRIFLPAIGIYRIVEVSGLDVAKALQPALFVVNHRCRMDALLVTSYLPGASVLIKARYARNPGLAVLVRHFGFVSIEPGRISALAESIARCKQRLSQGRRLLVFPEGTRASSGRLQPFKDFAFRLAVDTRVPIVPVVLHSNQPFMAKVRGSYYPREWNYFRIRFLEPERPREGDTAESLCDRVHERMARELVKLDEGTPWALDKRGVT